MVKMEKTKQVIHALRNKYDDNGNAYAFMEQVGNATGWDCNRHADAIVVSLWKSRGLTIKGFEVKVSRTDWLKELKHPEKAEPIAKYCHEWYLVLGDENIIQFGELPTNWGLIVPHTKKTLKIVKPAKFNEKPKTVDMEFLCGILRQAQSQVVDKAKLRAKYSEGYDDAQKDDKEEMEETKKYRDERIANLTDKIDKFEKSAGFGISDWTHKPEEVGSVVKMVLNGSYKKELDNLQNLHRHALNCARNIEEEIQKHKETVEKST